jgi:cytochrome c oxidase subunit II
MKIWFNLFKTGKYELACAELCGGGHYAMRAEYEVLSKADYDQWLDKQALAAAAMMAGTSAAPADTTASEPAAEGSATEDEDVWSEE